MRTGERVTHDGLPGSFADAPGLGPRPSCNRAPRAARNQSPRPGRARRTRAPAALGLPIDGRHGRCGSTPLDCRYCVHSHVAAARRAGMSDAMLAELLAVVGMANETNRLVAGYQIEVDPQFALPLE